MKTNSRTLHFYSPVSLTPMQARFINDAYTALLWTARQDGNSIDARYLDTAKIAKNDRLRFESDCLTFMQLAEEAGIDLFPDWPLYEGAGNRFAGHDFILTCQRTGSGFWDGDWDNRDEETGERDKTVSEALTQLCQSNFPEYQLEVSASGKTAYIEFG